MHDNRERCQLTTEGKSETVFSKQNEKTDCGYAQRKNDCRDRYKQKKRREGREIDPRRGKS